jgi:hypothetical protein
MREFGHQQRGWRSNDPVHNSLSELTNVVSGKIKRGTACAKARNAETCFCFVFLNFWWCFPGGGEEQVALQPDAFHQDFQWRWR